MTQTASPQPRRTPARRTCNAWLTKNSSDRRPVLSGTKAAPGTIKRLFGYILKFKIQVAVVVLCILVSAAAQA